jgi:hypothetical protein
VAVVIEAFTVIVRNSTLEEKYPGGREAFAADCPNRTYCDDGNLSRIAFMHSDDVRAFIEKLARKGLVPLREGCAIDVALVSSSHGLHAKNGCDWLVFATFKGVPVAWEDGKSPAPIVGPPGFELGCQMEYVTPEAAKDRFVYLRSEDGVGIYLDKTTGKEAYMGRVHGK